MSGSPTTEQLGPPSNTSRPCREINEKSDMEVTFWREILSAHAICCLPLADLHCIEWRPKCLTACIRSPQRLIASCQLAAMLHVDTCCEPSTHITKVKEEGRTAVMQPEHLRCISSWKPFVSNTTMLICAMNKQPPSKLSNKTPLLLSAPLLKV